MTQQIKDCRGLLKEQGPDALLVAVENPEPVENPESYHWEGDTGPEVQANIRADREAERECRETMESPPPDDCDLTIPANRFPIPAGRISITAAARAIFPAIAARKNMFIRCGVVHEVASSDNGRDSLRPVTPERFCGLVEGYGRRIVRLVTTKEGRLVWRKDNMPVGSAKVLLLSNVAAEELPSITQLANCPIITASGEVLARGYHSHAGGTFISRGKPPSEVPLEVAVKALQGLLADFAFVTAADRSRALASLISPALKMGGHIADDFPLDVAEADQSQSGKTYRQKMLVTIYGETATAITAPRGGVGSIDEAVATALITGRPFVSLDNFRGRVDSTILEEAIRGHGRVNCRALRVSAEVDIRPFLWQLSTNGAELTRDLANRSIVTRIRKQPDGYPFREFTEGDLLAHVQANQSFYLGAVFSVIREWQRNGCPKTTESRHDFRGWCRVLDWIVQHVFGAAPLLDGHREEQARTANPALQWLRDVCNAVKVARLLPAEHTASSLASIAEDFGIEFPGNPASREETQQRAGKILGRLFRESGGNPIMADGFTITRSEVTTYGNGPKIHKYYQITA